MACGLEVFELLDSRESRRFRSNPYGFRFAYSLFELSFRDKRSGGRRGREPRLRSQSIRQLPWGGSEASECPRGFGFLDRRRDPP